MNQTLSAELVARLEGEARARPRTYLLRVLALATVGYAYLGLILLLLLLSLPLALLLTIKVAWVGVKLLFIIIPFTWLVLRAMFVRVPPAAGIPLARADAPALFDMVDRLRAKLDCPRFHRVLVTGDYNASVIQTPRLGPFGWYRNELCLGLPLMKALTPEQFEAVLAHEMGHLAGGHGAISNHLYCLRMRWMQLLGRLDAEDSAGKFLFAPFFRRYAPYFEAYSFPLARANEYHADAVAGQLTAPRHAAAALTGVALGGERLDRHFWPQIQASATTRPEPEAGPYGQMSRHFATPLAEADRDTWLAEAMRIETGTFNTHPSLADRLAALGETACYAPPGEAAGADRLLEPACARITETMDQEWRRQVAGGWRARYDQAMADRERLDLLRQREAEGEAMAVDDALELAVLIDRHGSADEQASVPDRLAALHAGQPEHPALCLQLGARLLAAEPQRAASLLERAAQDRDCRDAALRLLLGHYHATGQADAARLAWERLSALMDDDALIARQRATIRTTDAFVGHELAPGLLEPLCAALARIEGLKRVYLVRRLLGAERWQYVLGFSISTVPWWNRADRESATQQAILAVDCLPPGTTVFCAQGSNDAFASTFARVPGSRIQ